MASWGLKVDVVVVMYGRLGGHSKHGFANAIALHVFAQQRQFTCVDDAHLDLQGRGIWMEAGRALGGG